MNWSEDNPSSAAESTDLTEAIAIEQTTPGALYYGDQGELPLDTRRTLMQLLAGPALDAHLHSKLWLVLLRDETVVRRYLAALFLDLVIDRDTQVAFTRQADTGELEVPSLLRRVPLTFIDSVLLLYLRQRLTQASAQGERAVVSLVEIIEYLTLYQRANNTDQAGFTKRIHAAVEKIKKYNVLRKIRSSEERFEISPTLKLLFSAEEIQNLTTLYQRKVEGEMSDQQTNLEENDDDS